MENLTKSVIKRLNCIYTTDIPEKFSSVRVLRTAYTQSPAGIPDSSNHRHSFNEIHIVLQGHANYSAKIEGTENQYRISKGECIIIPKKVKHQSLFLSDNIIRIIIAYESTVPDSNDPVSVIKVPADIESTIWFLLSDKCRLGFIDRYALFTSVAAQLSSGNTKEISEAESEEIKTHMQNPYASMILRYLNDNKNKYVTIQDIVNYCCCCQRQLNRILNSELNTNLSTLVSKHKLNLISYYLQKTDLPLKKISQLAGFSNEYSMSRFFCKEMLTSPDKYRKFSQGNRSV